MNEIEIKKHNFEIAKKRIGDFKLSNNGNSFARIDEKDFSGIFDHNVTGQEMNKHIDKVQNAFIGVNKYINDIVKEFEEIYNALDALDKKYINGIIKSLEKAQKAINENNKTVKNLEEHVKDLLDIKKRIDIFEQKIVKKSKIDIFFDSLYYKISIGIIATSSFVIGLILLFSK